MLGLNSCVGVMLRLKFFQREFRRTRANAATTCSGVTDWAGFVVLEVVLLERHLNGPAPWHDMVSTLHAGAPTSPVTHNMPKDILLVCQKKKKVIKVVRQ